MKKEFADIDIIRYCEIIKEFRLGGMPVKLGSVFNKVMFKNIVTESIGLVHKIGWDNYKKYIDSWTLGITDLSLTENQLKIIRFKLKK